jgi:hypothetical protein
MDLSGTAGDAAAKPMSDCPAQKARTLFTPSEVGWIGKDTTCWPGG